MTERGRDWGSAIQEDNLGLALNHSINTRVAETTRSKLLTSLQITLSLDALRIAVYNTKKLTELCNSGYFRFAVDDGVPDTSGAASTNSIPACSPEHGSIVGCAMQVRQRLAMKLERRCRANGQITGASPGIRGYVLSTLTAASAT